MKSMAYSNSFEMDVPVDDLFPLFSPEGEKLWVPGWDYDNVMGTTELSEDYIFLTKNHDHGAADAIWIVKRFDPDDHFVQFYKVEPEEKVGIVTVTCNALSASRTSVEVSYRYVALSASGEVFVEGFTKSDYDDFIDQWQQLLTAWFGQRC